MMRSALAWLRGDFVRLGSRATIRRHHAIEALLLAVALIAIFAAGVFVGFHYPYKTRPRPPLPPSQAAPPSDCAHVMGGCLPHPRTENLASITATDQGCDLSNNDPVYDALAWSLIAQHHAFCIFKVNENTYVDRTARPMAVQARAHHLSVGGYDFLHVCISSPTAEAHIFIAAARSALVTGPGSFPGVADVEYPANPQCNVRAWLAAWLGAVREATGRLPLIYTGAWWWQPHVGCWWPTGVLAWVSGYGVRYPYMPCGRTKLDMWQYTDVGALFGSTTSDMSRWLDGAAAFAATTSSTAAPSCGIFPTVRFVLAGGVRASECNTHRTWVAFHCQDPPRRPVCTSSHLHASLLRDRIWFVAHHRLSHGHWVSVGRPRWADDELGLRFRAFSQIVH